MPLTTFALPPRAFSTLRPRTGRIEHLQATLVASCWALWRDGSRPGLALDIAKARLHTHPEPKQKTPLFEITSGDLKAFIASDGSALVGRLQDNMFTVLPQIFRLRDWYVRAHPLTLRVRSTRAGNIRLSFQVSGGSSHLEAFAPDDPVLEKDPEKVRALQDIRDDLDRLMPAFRDLPYVAQPHNCPPAEALARKDWSSLGLGAVPAGAHVCAPDFLSQCWFGPEDLRSAEAWSKTFAAWVYEAMPDLDTACISLQPALPRTRHTKPPEFTLASIRNFRSAFVSSLDAPLKSFAQSFPVSIDRFVQLDLVTQKRSRKFQVKSPSLGLCHKPGKLSRHEAVFLQAQLGPMPDDLRDALTAPY